MKSLIIIAVSALPVLSLHGQRKSADPELQANMGSENAYNAQDEIQLEGSDWTMVEDLRGRWKFELGDSMQWANPGIADGKWDDIFVPSPWEDEGYPGYDGYAWYRRHFTVPSGAQNKQLYLHLGVIDDIDEAYVNGHFVGFEGTFPPHYITAYSASRIYCLPGEYLNYGGDNVVAVRVYDSELAGGMVRGRPGLYTMKNYLYPDASLAGTWKLRAGDDKQWKAEILDEHGWKDAHVPAYWETQGLKGYDGYGWYRRVFQIPSGLSSERLILLMGKIDDLDEVYLNGVRIGATGKMHDDPGRNRISDEWNETRAYTIPPDVMKFGQNNTIAVRVYDGFLHGGIYDGPVGLITRKHYVEWSDRQKKGWNFFDLLFEKK